MPTEIDIIELMDAATAASVAMNRPSDGLFEFLAEAQAGGFVSHRPLTELDSAEGARLREWMRGSAMLQQRSYDPDWLLSQVIIRMCEVRGALELGQPDEATLKARLAESAAGILARVLASRPARPLGADMVDAIERWR